MLREYLLVFPQEDSPDKIVNLHEAAKLEEAAETAEERAKRVASQWIKDDSTAPPPAAQEPQVCSRS